jgi:hypothetical protein
MLREEIREDRMVFEIGLIVYFIYCKNHSKVRDEINHRPENQ